MRIVVCLIVSILFGSSLISSMVFAEEIVYNKKGQAILLKDDGTWEQKITKTPGKFTISISRAINNYMTLVVEDDFEEFSHFENFVGCKYSYLVENNLDTKVIFNDFLISSKVDFEINANPLVDCGAFAKCSYVGMEIGKEIISSNSKISFDHMGVDVLPLAGNYMEITDGLYAHVGQSKKKLSDVDTKPLFKQYGCEAHLGNLSLIMGETNPDEYPIIEFPASMGIPFEETYKFIEVGEGAFPLKKNF